MISNNQMRCTFTSLGIQCVKKKDIEESLRLRESIKVDPFRTGRPERKQPENDSQNDPQNDLRLTVNCFSVVGFAHRSHATIDLNVVRLCFQVRTAFTADFLLNTNILGPNVCPPLLNAPKPARSS